VIAHFSKDPFQYNFLNVILVCESLNIILDDSNRSDGKEYCSHGFGSSGRCKESL